MTSEDDALRRSFDAIAGQYAREFAAELDRKPFDRELLERFARRAGRGRVLDLGCGPGQVGGFVARLGPAVVGVDFSAASLSEGRRLFDGVRFVCADFRRLPFPDASVEGIVAFYCLIYGPEHDAAGALGEWRRVLRAGAPLVVAVHGGEGSDHFDDFQGTPVDITIHWRDPERFAALVRQQGFAVDALSVRDPYPEEHPSRRVYVEATAS